jgi:hypothetical protein
VCAYVVDCLICESMRCNFPLSIELKTCTKENTHSSVARKNEMIDGLHEMYLLRSHLGAANQASATHLEVLRV